MGMYPGGHIVRVSPTLSTDAYAQGDVLFNLTEIKDAVPSRGGASILRSIFMVDYSDAGNNDIQIIFTEKNTTELGSVNATANISDANFKANNLIGTTFLDADQATTGDRIDNLVIQQSLSSSQSSEAHNPLLLVQAKSGSTSIYFSGVLHSSTTPTFADDSLEFIFHFEYLG